MREVNLGISGQRQNPAQVGTVDELSLNPVVKTVLQQYLQGQPLRPLQWQVFGQAAVQEERRHLLVTAPTNSGKSLVGHVLALETVLLGKRVVILEPLRALAEEQAIALEALVSCLPKAQRPKVRITTGDYRIIGEFRDDEAPQDEILVATYERFDALTRQESAAVWLSTIGLVVLDEAHMLGDDHRGVALEFLVSHLLSLPVPPRLVLLSASIANPANLATWLKPCTVVQNTLRTPALQKKAWLFDSNEDVDAALIEQVLQILGADETHRVLIFVYQKASAEKLVRTFASRFSGKTLTKKSQTLETCLDCGVAWYHADLSQASRAKVRDAFLSPEGKVRVVACTTTLMMGVNLPATHAIVRDVIRPGASELETDEIIQMLGRAGRGDRSGTGIVVLKDSKQIQQEQRIAELQSETLPDLHSQLLHKPPSARDYPTYEANEILSPLLGLLVRAGGSISPEGLENRIEQLWGGAALKQELRNALRTLYRWKLAYQEPETQVISATRLGEKTARVLLPVDMVAGLAAFIRDSLSSKPDGSELAKLSEIDLLLLIILASNRFKLLISWSKNNETGILNRHVQLSSDERSVLMKLWFPSPNAADVDGFLGLLDPHTRPGLRQQESYRKVIRSLHLALLLRDLANGVGVNSLQKTYGVKDLLERQEQLQDTAIWLLHGLERLLEIPHFYYYLKENVKAEIDVVKGAEQNFRLVSQRIFNLVGNLRFASPLGGLLRQVAKEVKQINRVRKEKDANAIRLTAPGVNTLERLIAAGYTMSSDIAKASLEDLVKIGVRPQYAEIVSLVARNFLL